MKTLIYNVTVLTMDETCTVYKDGWLLTDGERIAAVGSGEAPSGADRVLDGEGGILMPGMINLHSHIPMIPFRSMGDDCPDRLRRFLFPLELAAMNPELVYLASLYAACELLLAGVTSVLDMYYFEDEVAKACAEAGIRGFLGETVINMETCDSGKPCGGLEYGRWFLEKWKGHPLITPIVASHAANTSSPEKLREAWELSREFDTLYTLHASEMDYEMEAFRKNGNQTPTEFLYGLGVLGEKTIAAHCIHMTEHDLDLLAQTGTKVAHCIGANTKAGKGVAPVRDMRARGITVGLGTDGPSSGNTLDLFTQFRLFPAFQKTKYHDRSLFPAKEIVALGTLEGAKALGREQDLGSLKPGKAADLVLVETGSVNMFPVYNPYSVLVYSANASNVDTVFVNGRMVVRRKKLVGRDLAALRGRLSAAMAEFNRRAEAFADII